MVYVFNDKSDLLYLFTKVDVNEEPFEMLHIDSKNNVNPKLNL